MGWHDVSAVGKVQLGHFKEPVSLEQLTSANQITFMERSVANALVPSRNTGVMVQNNASEDRIQWAAGVFRTTGSDGDFIGSANNWAFSARVTGLPWYQEEGKKLVHVGLSGSYRKQDVNAAATPPEMNGLPDYVAAAVAGLDSVTLLDGEVAANFGSLSLQGEFIQANNDVDGASSEDWTGFYVFASYLLTGEHRPYNTGSAAFDPVKPAKNFREGGSGAWEVALRYSSLDLDDSAGGMLDDITAGVNWYMNPNSRLMLNYVYADEDTLGSSSAVAMRYQVFF
jgi:phosphate-selective porin OprO/OprP